MCCISTLKKIILLILLLTISVTTTMAESLTIASGAGYRKLVDELCIVFYKQTGIKTDKIYGNMGQITSQARVCGMVDIVVGDRSFFKKAGLTYDQEYVVGQGKLVLAFAKGIRPVSIEALKSEKVRRISQPDPARAIYGKAATEFLANSNLEAIVSNKLIIVGTAPQVSAYLIAREVDLGFINLTGAIAIQDKIEGYVEIPRRYYNEIVIVALKMSDSSSSKTAEQFGEFLGTELARSIAAKYGM